MIELTRGDARRTRAASPRCAAVDLAVERGRAGRDRRAVRLGQVHDAAPDRHPRPAHRRGPCASTGYDVAALSDRPAVRAAGHAGSASSSSSSTSPPGVRRWTTSPTACSTPGVGRGRAAAAGRGGAGAGRARAPARPPAARAVRRRAAAGRHRPGGGRRPGAAAGRRADRQPGLGLRRRGAGRCCASCTRPAPPSWSSPTTGRSPAACPGRCGCATAGSVAD